jgi:excisionase family DNA binding protein
METTAFLFSIPEASRLLSVSRNHLYKLIKTGRIPAYRLSPRVTRVDLAELRSLLKLANAEAIRDPSAQGQIGATLREVE